MQKVAVVILNWNGKNHLEEFLPSVVENSTDAEVWVADNGSTDDSLKYINENFSTVKTIILDNNYGFTGGYNRALKQIDADYYVLLNSDVKVTKDWISPVVEVLDADDSIGAAMPKLLSYSTPKYFEYAGAAGGFIDKYGFPFCRGRIISEIEEDLGQYNDRTEIFWATGACLFVKAKLFHELGGLDEEFFAHMEEIDLCWRMKSRGFKVMYIPSSTVYHLGGGTLPNNNPRKLFLNYRNNLYLLYKNLPKGRFRAILFKRMMLDGASALVYLVQGKWSFFAAVPKAHFAFYSSLKTMRNKRKVNNDLRIVKYTNAVYQRSIVFDFFLNKKHKFSELKGFFKKP